MALTAIALFSATGSWWELLVISGIFTLANIPSVTLWTLAGMQLQRWLTTSIRIKNFNVGMASLLLLSAVAML